MVPNDDLIVGVEIETKRGKRNVEDLNNALAKNTEQTKKIQEELKRLEKEYKSIATAVKKLPQDQLNKMSREVEKAEAATRDLADQLDKTVGKLDRVADRIDITTEQVVGFSAVLGTAVAWLGRFQIAALLAGPIRFTGQIVNATQAVRAFKDNVIPFAKDTARLMTEGVFRMRLAVTSFTSVFAPLAGAIREQRQLLQGYSLAAVYTGRVVVGLNTALVALNGGASRLNRAFTGILDFSQKTGEGLSRVTRVFKTIGETAVATGNMVRALGKGLFTTFGQDTAGAARINPWTQIFMALQEGAKTGISSVTKFASVATSRLKNVRVAAFGAGAAVTALGVTLLNSDNILLQIAGDVTLAAGLTTLAASFYKSSQSALTFKSGVASIIDLVDDGAKALAGFAEGLFTTFGPDSVGAARINPWTKLLTDMQVMFGRGMASVKSFFSLLKADAGAAFGVATAAAKQFGSTILSFAGTGALKIIETLGYATGRFSAILSNAGGSAKSLLIAIDQLAARGFVAMLDGIGKGVKGLIDFGVRTKFFTSGIFAVIEAGQLLGATMVGLGTYLKSSENKIVSFIGSVLQLAGVLSVSLSGAATIALAAIGSFLSTVGDKILNTMSEWEAKFRKAQEVMVAFTFTIRGFSKEFGEATVGSLEFWNDFVNEMVKTSSFGFQDIQKSIKLLITEGQALGLNAQDNVKVIKAAGDLASVTGSNIADVSLAIVKAMGGMGASLQSLGVFTTEAALAHSNLVHQQNINIETLSIQEKAQLVLNSVLEQTAPLVGAAANQVNTLTGAQQQYTAAVEKLQTRLGFQNSLIVYFTQLQTSLVNIFNRLDDEVINFASTLVDLAGTTFKVAGFMTTWIVTIVSLISFYKLLNNLVSASILVQSALTLSLGTLGKVLGANVGVITSLNAALLTMVKLVIPAAIATIKTFAVIIGTAVASVRAFLTNLFLTAAGWKALTSAAVIATRTMAAFTLSVVTNPIFIKGALIAASIAIVYTAVKQLHGALKSLTEEIILVENESSGLSDVLEDIADSMRTAFQFLVDVVKVAIIGWMKLITMIKVSATGFQMLKAKVLGNAEAFEKLDIEGDILLGRLETLDDAMGTAFSGEKVAHVYKFARAAKEVSNSVRGFSDSLKLSSEAADGLKIDILGDEFDRANKKFSEAVKLLNNIRDQGVIKVGAEILMPTTANIAKLVSGALDTKEDKAKLVPDTKALEKAMIDAEGARLELVKMRKEGLKELGKTQSDLEIRALESAQKEIDAIKKRGSLELEEFRKKIERQNTIAPLTRSELLQYKKVEQAIQAATDAEVARKKATIDEQTLEKLKKEADEYARLRDAIMSLNKETLSASGQEVGAAKIELAMQRMKLGALKESLMKQKEFVDSTGQLKEEFAEVLEAADDLAAKNFADVLDAQGFAAKFSKAMESVAPESFGGKMAAGFVTGAVAGASKIEKALQSIDTESLFSGDFSGLKESFADIFDSMDTADFGASLVASFTGGAGSLFDSLSGMFSSSDALALVDMGKDFANLPIELLEAFGKIDVMIQSFLKRFPEALNQFLKAIPGVFQKILEKLPELVAVLMDGLIKVVEMLPTLLNQFLEKLPAILQEFLARLPELLEAVFSSLGDIVGSILENLPDVLVKLMEHIPDIVESFIIGFANSMDKVVFAFVNFLIGGGLEKIVVALVKMMPRLALALVNGFIKGIARSIGRIFGGMEAPEALTSLPEKFKEGLSSLAKTATEESSKLFKVLDMEAAAQGIQKAQAIEDALDRGIDRFQIKFEGLVAMLLETWNKIRDGVLFLLGGWLVEFNKALMDMAMKALEFGLKIFEGLATAIQGAWSFIQEIGAKIWAGLISAANQVIDVFSQWGVLIWNGLKSGLDSAASFLWDMGTNIWNGLKSGLSGIGSVIQSALNGINPSALFDKMFSIPGSAWGKGTVEKALGIDIPYMKFASGGMVPGKASTPGDSAINDKILAFLSPGEAVIPRSKMQNPEIAAIIKSVLEGDFKPAGMALGGVLGSIVSGGSDFLSGLSQGTKDLFSSLGSAGSVIYNSLPKASFDSLVKAIEGGLDIKTAPIGDIMGAVGSFTDAQKVLGALGKTISGPPAETLNKIWTDVQKNSGFGKDLLKSVLPGDLWKLAKEHAFASVMKMFEGNRFHGGGMVPGFAMGGDVPAMLQGGEFVLNRAASRSIGINGLNALNNGGGALSQQFNFEINLDVRSEGLPDESFIRQRLIPSMKKELKEASLRGEFIMSERGVRKT